MLCAAEGSISRGTKSVSTGLLRHTVNTWQRSIVCLTPHGTVDEVCYHLSASSDGETPKDFDYCHGTHFFSFGIEFPAFTDCVKTQNAVLEGIWKKAEETKQNCPCSELFSHLVESRLQNDRMMLLRPGRFSCDN